MRPYRIVQVFIIIFTAVIALVLAINYLLDGYVKEGVLAIVAELIILSIFVWNYKYYFHRN
ncbi:MAG: hypothetical protein A3J07_01595 [Candidatus Doudnabacteria bacterium RIFCSPLOWO2_02_FULL_49_13]|uniref:Uncharacterized protein n=1 Tax=Candidatus Doudnabacteria bacterium RIFCSPHIGHO2_12_FULL_48_16 TaxID=1817838 RepID=A0A1F5PLA1_9BACT|nr:MAG: hypothetical protein A3B77_01120 [Candidatus Doudnabacteria bacterium RIFCSPHIGHO2_02_FULL_49_24]OGE88843.1 MAG: hypothetical protein A2760_01475 [Candidatus Doudnabacteria bacterium RIFCSPHIGHO2_01_FULL_50_67]OGE90637.1 MAG: hypothetical protein A3E29_00690 [Candidatus Doudnabacteria bacterium RIFCSPHIGHO2_12_FULL_48_16]OGE96968.1 MAG: hypothetical protein A2990_02720 [Candidatus Doudnabacteria bacterium RIFCSPLOWO2_01_FULL_49_40]OGF02469.1 MAG: hypothetical protein A3H14_03230 [Candid